MFVILNDTHIGEKGFCPVVSNYMLNYHLEKVLPYMREHGIKKIIHLGDVFHNREKIDIDILRSWKTFFFNLLKREKIDLHIICGNHDTYYKNTNDVNSLEEFLGNYSNIKIYTEAEIVDLGECSALYLPWITPENTERSLQTIAQARTSGVNYIFGHLEIAGFKMNSGINSEHGLDRKTFKGFKRVMTGHFHSKSTQNNVYYLGSQYHMNWGDYGEARGFHVFDPASNKLDFVENESSLFYRIDYRDGVKAHPEVTGKVVKIVVEERKDVKKYDLFIDEINKLAPHSLAIVENLLDDSEAKENNIEAKDTLTIVHEYIDLIDGIEDKNYLKEMFSTLYTDALEQMRLG